MATTNRGPKANKDVLLAVSGAMVDLQSLGSATDASLQLSKQRHDYEEIDSQLGYTVLDAKGALASSRMARLIRRVLGDHVAFAVMVFRQRSRHRVIVTGAEHTGIVLAGLMKIFGRRGCKHIMISHILSSRKKPLLLKTLRLERQIDKFVVYSTAQRDFAHNELAIDPAKVEMLKFGVDEEFFRVVPVDIDLTDSGSRSQVSQPDRGLPTVVAVGAEARDYETFLAAVDGLDCEVKIAAGSHWSTTKWQGSGALPDNVEVLGFLHPTDLRLLYQQASMVVVPLHETMFQAGLTTIVEAMAMASPVVYSRTAGQTDAVVDGVTGLGVAPGDVGALRLAIQSLLDDPELGNELGLAGRKAVEADYGLDRFVHALSALVTEVSA